MIPGKPMAAVNTPEMLARAVGVKPPAGVNFRDSLVQGMAEAQGIRADITQPESTVRGFIQAVDAKDKVAQEMRTAFLAGESTNLHQTVIASQEASVAFSLMVEMRNKILESYQELMRIQI